MDNKENQSSAKEKLGAFWQKTLDASKKATEGAISLVEQTKESIHEQQAKRYKALTATDFKSKDFKTPNVIEIENDSANRDFITSPDAIGWLETHKDVEVLHLYAGCVKKCGITFVPVPQVDNIFCVNVFDSKKYTNVNQIFGKATEEKLAELRNVAYCLGAKMCSIEIVEVDKDTDIRSSSFKLIKASASSDSSSETRKMQSGKTVSQFEGHNNPTIPQLKWFAHDDNIKGLIEMRMKFAIKANSMELKGSSLVSMSQKTACAIDALKKSNGSHLSLEKESIKEHSQVLLFDIEF